MQVIWRSSEVWALSLPYLTWQLALKVLASFGACHRGAAEGNVFFAGGIRSAAEHIGAVSPSLLGQGKGAGTRGLIKTCVG